MKKVTLIGATSALALCAAMPLAFAQTSETKQEPAAKGSATTQSAPEPRGSGPAAQGEKRGTGNAGQARSVEDKAGGKTKSSSDQTDGNRSRGGKQAESDTKARKGEAGKQAGDDQRRTSKSDDAKARADRTERTQATRKDAQKMDREGQDAVRGRDDKSGAKRAADSDVTVKEKSRQAGTKDGAKQATGSKQATAQLTVEQRDTLRQRLVQSSPPRVTNVNITIRIGERLPRRVELRPLPVVIVDEFPQYRGYRYVMIRDEICIVNPATYEIVEVIGTTRGSGAQVALSLSSAERRFVYDEIVRSFDPIDLDMRLAIGVDLPTRVEFHSFPERVVERIPDLRRYRFVRTHDRVLVVEPSEREVVLLIGN